MSERVDLVCGDPAFVDLTFAGLDGLPGLGEERHARDLLRSPGGAATVAIGAARLGLSVALATPLGADPEGDFLRAALAAEGVRCSARTVARTPVTAVLPWAGERAMATFLPQPPLQPDDVAAFAPRAVVLSLPWLHCAPADAALYVTVGDAEARASAGALPAGLSQARALIVNAREAMLLAGADDPVAAARTLAETVPRVVVTLGPDGALAIERGELVRVPGVAVEAVDTTGAGDLFTATYIWSELRGAGPELRLHWACLAAALSVRVPTAVAGAQPIDGLAAAGKERGLALPANETTEILGGSE
ncbi:MAG TPA: PfkB family carbohydrate kinase [Conexibacter sp.]|nr:PfkB family carbohydrate kinase [Conexibacter sp.]